MAKRPDTYRSKEMDRKSHKETGLATHVSRCQYLRQVELLLDAAVVCTLNDLNPISYHICMLIEHLAELVKLRSLREQTWFLDVHTSVSTNQDKRLRCSHA